jgi:uncharacterized protein (DUF1501 family)
LLGGLSLASAAALAGCRASPSSASLATNSRALAQGPKRLVLVEMYGGNDGLTTVVPFRDDAFYRARPTTAIAPEQCLRFASMRGLDRGLHPALTNFRERFDAGELAIVEGCGYPEPVYSHFKSLEIWHTAREQGRSSGDGWIGRVRCGPWGADPRAELVVHVGSHLPYSLASQTHPTLAFDTPENFVWVGSSRELAGYGDAGRAAPSAGAGADVLAHLRETLRAAQSQSPRILKATSHYRPRIEYPADDFGRSMRTIAALMHSDFETRVYSVALGNFDTHAGSQNVEHARLLAVLDSGLGAFLEDIQGSAVGDNTLVVCYSEFGRRVEENYSRGTDHGSAGPMFLLGPRVHILSNRKYGLQSGEAW